MMTIAILLITLVLMGVSVGFAASFAGGLSPAFLLIMVLLFAVMFVFALSQDWARNLWGALLIIIILALLFILRTPNALGPEFLPELFKENPNFSLGICA